MKKLIFIVAATGVAIAMYYLFIYEKPGPAEELGRKLDKGIEKIQYGDESSMQKAGRKTRELIDDVGNKLSGE